MALENIHEFVIPMALVEQTLKPMRRAGRAGYEAFVLWGGRAAEPDIFTFEVAYCPRQRASRTDEGLLVVVEGAELFRVNRAFYERGLTLAGQIHSHPTDAYHSSTDDTYPLITLKGGLSGVVPDFGRGGKRQLADWAWYRLAGAGDWTPVADETRITFV
jgi:hypothetical protein